jgi:hypothetical protein
MSRVRVAHDHGPFADPCGWVSLGRNLSPQARLLALFEGRRRGDKLLTLLVNSDLAHEALLVTSGFLNERCAAYRVDPRNFSRCVRAQRLGSLVASGVSI